MKKINFSMVLNLMFILLIFASFYFQYEYLFVTRIVVIVFATVYFMIEIKKAYFSKNKTMFIMFSVISLIALIVSIIVDNTLTDGFTSDRIILIPVFVFILIGSMYKDLYDKTNNKSSS
ncbi:hypothetical protein JSQ81_06310 [Sporosarcina sp. Marseille-Q4063]|uniref:hypothetical protein n=1 Tax=Sporosarcina sp. Marseille-Q4063 TaxID=2810514 RepID=UPI001BAE99DB|nr:hypothetical protein [Sporosarcina sp. Marseille-Q4063]QUW23172.1 hypothetical protein JSQ81_06310 [Sporosarcina sp. Marseille-Q4063]